MKIDNASYPESQDKAGKSKNKPIKGTEGIHGWLAYFTFGLFVSVGFSIYNAYELGKGLSGVSIYHGQFLLDTLFFTILAVAQIAAIYLIVKLSKDARKFVIGTLALTIFAYSFDAGVSNVVYHYVNQSPPADAYSGLDRAIVFGIIWIIYFSVSKRVKLTLVK